MARTYHQIYLHLVFAVKYRKALLDKSWRKKVFGLMGYLVNEKFGNAIIINGVEDHVHCFVKLKPSQSVAMVVKEIKAKSSKWINEQGLTPERFEWQRGYACFSQSRSQVKRVFRYIENQENHHNKVGFDDEYVSMLDKHGIPYDERYIFTAPD